jgi:hypothetical protein
LQELEDYIDSCEIHNDGVEHGVREKKLAEE